MIVALLADDETAAPCSHEPSDTRAGGTFRAPHASHHSGTIPEGASHLLCRDRIPVASATPGGDREMPAHTHRALLFTRVALTTVVSLAVAACPLVYASDVSFDQMPPSYYALMKMKPAEQMRLMDPDKKGYVTKDEFMKFHKAMAAKMFDNMDKNHDGKLTEAEFEEAQRVAQTHSGP
jgi:EF hand domain-containing protein